MKQFFLFAFSFVFLTPVTRAQESTAKLDLATQLVDAMEFCTMMDRGLDEMKNNQIRQMQAMGNNSGAAITKDVERTFELIKEVMDCETMKAETAAIYADLFSGEELQGLINFYQSEVGKSFNQKQPEMMRRSMEVSMKRMQKIMPMIMQKVQQEKQEVLKAPAVSE